jgi:hypothetical protein
MEMDQAYRQNSKDILAQLGKSLSEAYPIETSLVDLSDLLEKLDNIGYTREDDLDEANQQLERLLSNTANQIAQ